MFLKAKQVDRGYASRAKFFAASLPCLIIASFVVLVGACGCSRDREQRGFSWSIAEAKRRGTFVYEVEIVPNCLSFEGKKITFEAAWLESQPAGHYALCFRIDQGKNVFTEGIEFPFFVLGERDAGFSARHGRNWLQFIESLDSDDLSSVRVSLLRNWKEKRPRDIRFMQKDK